MAKFTVCARIVINTSVKIEAPNEIIAADIFYNMGMGEVMELMRDPNKYDAEAEVTSVYPAGQMLDAEGNVIKEGGE